MTVLSFGTFNGEAPKVHPLQLAEGFAQKAINVRLDRGRAEPYATMLDIGKALPSNTKTMFLYNDVNWFVSNEIAPFVEAPLSNDPEKYVVFPGTDYPRITRNDVAIVSEPFPTASYRLGVPKPVTQASVIKNGAEPVDPVAPGQPLQQPNHRLRRAIDCVRGDCQVLPGPLHRRERRPQGVDRQEWSPPDAQGAGPHDCRLHVGGVLDRCHVEPKHSRDD